MSSRVPKVYKVHKVYKVTGILRTEFNGNESCRYDFMNLINLTNFIN